MKLVRIPAGEFMMGSPDADSAARDAEKPQHRVRITKPFYLGMYEVTQAQYEQVMGNNPSYHKASGSEAPVDRATWEEADEFCWELSDLPEEIKMGRRYRLPTEAEWAYAARAGSTGTYCYGDDESLLGDYAWWDENAGAKTHPVGQKKPNAWGLYDVLGNVREWCADWYQVDYYASSPTDDPTGPSTGLYRVERGAHWGASAAYIRSAIRTRAAPDYRSTGTGFRVALVPAE